MKFSESMLPRVREVVLASMGCRAAPVATALELLFAGHSAPILAM